METATTAAAVQRDIPQTYPVKDKAKPFFLSKAGNETVAILIHGFTGTPYDMHEIADFLHERNIDVVALRVAGHGTAIHDLMSTTYADWWRSVKEEIDAVAQNYRRVFLIGYSFGSNLVLDMAAREPGKYDGIVCLGTAVFLKYRLYYDFLAPFLSMFGVQKLRKPYIRKKNITSYESLGNYSEIPLNSLAQFRYFIDHYTKRELPTIMTPALLIHSRDDRISHPRSSEYVFEHLGSPYKEMFIMNELNHNPLRSENKNKIFNRIADFIQE